MPSILIIDDNPILCETLSQYILKLGHKATYALSIREGLEKVSTGFFDVVFLDVRLPDGNGLEVLPQIQQSSSSPEVFIITGLGDADGAELAINSGAWAYVQKPLSMKNISLQLERALQFREKKIQAKSPVLLRREGIIGNSKAIKRSLSKVAFVARRDANVLITGETGTGKELFAKAIHDNSLRAEKKFVVVDCASLQKTLVESILFGHEKGAFTGADNSREGLIKQADGGTLVLDEIGELPLPVQKEFLRGLQEHRFRPLGSDKEIKSDFRLISTTNRNLKAMVKSKRFRKDLYFRLQTVSIELPPLHKRADDIKELAMHYMFKLCQRYGTETKGFSPDFMDVLSAYDWPGNVRELINTIESVITFAWFEPTLFPRHLPSAIRVFDARAGINNSAPLKHASKSENLAIDRPPKFQIAKRIALSKVEKEYLEELMRFTKGNIKQARSVSGLSQSRLYDLLKKYKIRRS